MGTWERRQEVHVRSWGQGMTHQEPCPTQTPADDVSGRCPWDRRPRVPSGSADRKSQDGFGLNGARERVASSWPPHTAHLPTPPNPWPLRGHSPWVVMGARQLAPHLGGCSTASTATTVLVTAPSTFQLRLSVPSLSSFFPSLDLTLLRTARCRRGRRRWACLCSSEG